MSLKNGPLVLAILDGWGVAPRSASNAISVARTIYLDSLYKFYPHTTLSASGIDVGLLENQAGNSEAGHLNIGAGRIVKREVKIIMDSIAEGSFFENPAFLKAISHASRGGGRVHLMGLLSGEQSPHSHPDHLQALLQLLRAHQVKEVYLHLFTDGRDSSPRAGKNFMKKIINNLRPNEQVVTVAGRCYGMDRKKDWSRTKRTYEAIVLGVGLVAKSPVSAIEDAYLRGETDEFIQPTIIQDGTDSNSRVVNGDSVIFFNFRPDRARQLTKAFMEENFEQKNPDSFYVERLKDLCFVSMAEYGPELSAVVPAYKSVTVEESLPFVLKDYRQLYVAESEKYAHITYFFNGKHKGQVAGEKQIVIPSPDVLSYDQAPEMSARRITDIVVKAIKDNEADFVCVNYANADMMGHTENFEAAVKAIELIDKCLRRIGEAIVDRGGIFAITADHGNAEKMFNDEGEPLTEHTATRVPFILMSPQANFKKIKLRSDGILGDVAPTLLQVTDISKPEIMTGQSLIVGA